MIDVATIISVITGVLLAISESLPFIKTVKAQGVMHFLVNIWNTLLTSNSGESQPLLNDIDHSTSLNINQNQNQNQDEIESEFQQNGEIRILIDNINSNFDSKMNVLSNTINNMSGNINNVAGNINTVSTNVNYISQILKDISNDFKTARQLKLQTSELYQLNYIINYIKQNYIKRQLKFKNLSKNNKELLSSEGYIINYDSQEDTSVIGW
jgi:archaellum component FlaC